MPFHTVKVARSNPASPPISIIPSDQFSSSISRFRLLNASRFCPLPCIQPQVTHEQWEYEYHLTLQGWVSGSFYFRGTLARKVQTPSDRILTLVQESGRASENTGMRTTWRREWRSPAHSRAEIDLLLTQFGHRPPDAMTFSLGDPAFPA